MITVIVVIMVTILAVKEEAEFDSEKADPSANLLLKDMRELRKDRDLALTGRMAKWYDKNTKRYRIEEMKNYAKMVFQNTKNGDSILEVAPGPGYLSIELAKHSELRVSGIDISKDMVDIARNNARASGVFVDFRQGNASSLPFEDNSFDLIVCTAAFKNFKEPIGALNEMSRVLKRGGVAIIGDMDRDITDNEIEDYVANHFSKAWTSFTTKIIFKRFLRKGAYSIFEYREMISRSNFKTGEIKKEGIGLLIYLRRGD